MKLLIVVFFVSTALLLLNSCNTTEPPIIPPPDLRKITLTFEDASCTEVWLRVKVDSITLPVEIKLMHDATLQNITLTIKDSVIYIDSLNPNQAYNYQAVLSTDTTIKSEKVTAQTLAPTSHNFTWQTWEFGEHSSSVLYDVAIIDENNIWAVGEIYMNDSLGNPDPIAYNAAYWNGSVWELKKIAVTYNGNQTIAPLKGVFVLPSGEIIFSSGLPYLPQGNGWKLYHLWDMGVLDQNDGSVDRIWGTSINDLYFVGSKGTIVHYQNSTWTKIESGTTLHLTDIYGDNKGNIYAAGVDISLAKGVVLKKNSPNNWSIMIEGEIINESQLFQKLFGRLGTLWVDEIGTLYVGADFLYQFKNSKWDFVRSLPENYLGGDQYYIGYLYSIRGKKSNDIIIAGDRNTLRHFNGIDWSEIGIPYLPTRHIFWRSVQMKDNLTVTVGDEGIKAKIIMLTR